MEFQDNFSEILLIAERPVLFYCKDPYLKTNIDFEMKLISIADSFTHPYIQHTIALFNLTLKEIQDSFKCSNAGSLWEVLNIIGLNSQNYIMATIRYTMNFLFANQFQIIDNLWYLNNIVVNEELFNRIKDIVLVTSGIKKFTEQDKLQVAKPQWLIEKEREIRRIKNQSKNQNSNGLNELSKILLPLAYEFHYSLDELFNMNYYHIQFLSKYIPKIVSYDVQKRQIMSKKKLKYITET